MGEGSHSANGWAPAWLLHAVECGSGCLTWMPEVFRVGDDSIERRSREGESRSGKKKLALTDAPRCWRARRALASRVVVFSNFRYFLSRKKSKKIKCVTRKLCFQFYFDLKKQHNLFINMFQQNLVIFSLYCVRKMQIASSERTKGNMTMNKTK